MREPYITTAQLAEASGASLEHIRQWTSLGALKPARKDPQRNRYRSEQIIEATQLDELRKAGLTHRQLLQIANIQRPQVAGLRPFERLVRRFELYIDVMVTLATIFGAGPTFSEWYLTQQAQLNKMRAELAPDAKRRRPHHPHRELLRLFLAAQQRDPLPVVESRSGAIA